MFEFNGKYYAYAYDSGPLVQLDKFGSMIAIVVNQELAKQIEAAMAESGEHADE